MVSEEPRNSLLHILQYTPPRLYTGKEWYIGFYALDPAQNKMRRKKIKLNFIRKVAERRSYAAGLIRRLNMQLMNGWNPWIEADNSRAYHTIDDVFMQYRRFIEKMFADNIYREDTYTSYVSYLKNVEDWNNIRTDRASYIYQFDCTFVRLFLEYIYIERGNSPQTRDNYLGWMRSFSTWLVQQQYLKAKPTDGVPNFGKRTKKKQRSYIPPNDMMRIKHYIEATNKHYLLGCYILFYCFVRPKEIGQIKIKDISLERQTLFIPDTNSKNRKDGTITIPAKVLCLMIDLNVFNYPGNYYLFSNNFLPGEKHKDEKQFRDFWGRQLRPALKLPANYKFYSLKDTGITTMLRTQASITVRDQARHSSLLMTDTYTPHDIQEANDLIKNHETPF